jgi:hypothetical protein
MLALNINAVKNRFVKCGLSALIIVTLLAVAAVSFFGCASGQQNPGTAKDTGAFTAEISPYPPSGTNLAYYKTDKVATAGKLLTFTIAATDPDGGWLDYSASNLPDGSAFDSETLTFSWTPRYDQAGIYSVHFEVTDGEFTDSEDITITVVQISENWDVNGDGAANVLDIVLVGQRWAQTGLTGWVREDTNEDGVVDVLDIIVIGQGWTG